MRPAFFCLFFLSSLLAADLAHAAKCKTAWCRWLNDTQLLEKAGKNPWPHWPSFGYNDAPYQSMFVETPNTMIAVRYVRMPDLTTLALKRSYDPEQLEWVQWDVRWQEIRREANNGVKKARKYHKKKSLVGDAMDILYEIRNVDGLPVWRVHVKPLTFDFGPEGADLRFLRATRITDEHIGLALPDLADTPAGEMRTSDWQFCAQCVVDGSAVNNLNRSYFRDTQARAKAQELMPKLTEINIVPLGIKLEPEIPSNLALEIGESALAAASEVSRRHHEAEAIRVAAAKRAAELAETYKAERAAYDALLSKLDDDGLPARRKKACGDMQVRGAPNGNNGLLRPEDFEEGSRQNASRYREHMDCVSALIDDYDYAARAKQLADYQRELNALFVASRFEDRTPAKVTRVAAEVDALNSYLRQQEQRMRDVNRAFDRQWDVYLRARERRREERIAKEVDKCIAALYATQSLTPNSRSYCRRMAEQGYTGMSAAAVGYQGNRSQGSGNLAYQKPTLPSFDLNGMIANAKAVADGADSSVLWDDSGSIRTTRNPDLPVSPAPQPVAQRSAPRPVDSTPVATAPVASAGETATVPVADVTDSSGGTTASTESANTTGGSGINITVATTIPSADDMRALEEGRSPAGSTTSVQASGGSSSPGTSRAGSVGSSTDTSGPAPAPETERIKKPAKYVWVEDVFFEERGFAFSTREEAIRNLQKTWARSGLQDYCEETYEGSDGQNGVVTVDEIQVEQIGSTRWVGSATVDGYCRIHSHDKSYDEVSNCVSERRGLAGCAVRERY